MWPSGYLMHTTKFNTFELYVPRRVTNGWRYTSTPALCFEGSGQGKGKPCESDVERLASHSCCFLSCCHSR